MGLGLFGRVTGSDAGRRGIGKALALGLAVDYFLWLAHILKIGGAYMMANLPLSLCNVTALGMVWVLLTQDIEVFEVIYFWAIVGNIHALLTPDINILSHSYPVQHFLIQHYGTIVGLCYATLALRLRPQWKSIWKSFLVINAYVAFIAVFNWIYGTNYLYLCHKPTVPTLLNQFGPWPGYILVADLYGLVSFALCYSPFLILDFVGREQNRCQNLEGNTPVETVPYRASEVAVVMGSAK